MRLPNQTKPLNKFTISAILTLIAGCAVAYAQSDGPGSTQARDVELYSGIVSLVAASGGVAGIYELFIKPRVAAQIKVVADQIDELDKRLVTLTDPEKIALKAKLEEKQAQSVADRIAAIEGLYSSERIALADQLTQIRAVLELMTDRVNRIGGRSDDR